MEIHFDYMLPSYSIILELLSIIFNRLNWLIDRGLANNYSAPIIILNERKTLHLSDKQGVFHFYLIYLHNYQPIIALDLMIGLTLMLGLLLA